MNAIVAVDNNFAIGYKGELLVRIHEDMRRFSQLTTGKVIVLGRKTLETFPGKLPLKNRVNIIITHNRNLFAPGAVVVGSPDEARKEIAKYSTEDVFIVGGSSIYNEFYHECDTVYATKVDYEYQADAYFPNLDKDPGWEIVDESDERTCHDIIYTWVTYKRNLTK